jgi:hypothetical protein
MLAAGLIVASTSAHAAEAVEGVVAGAEGAPDADPVVAKAATQPPWLRFGGQYRLNLYSEWRSRKDVFEDDDVAGARLRLRPTFDATVSKRVALHLQLNIGHIHANQTNARFTLNGSHAEVGDVPAFGVRHAVIRSQLHPSLTNETGLVPLSDRFGDTLFSGDWDFNPLATAFNLNWSKVQARVAGGRLQENIEARTSADNADILLFDIDAFGFGASAYVLSIGSANAHLPPSRLINAGFRYSYDEEALRLRAFVVGSQFRPRGGTPYGKSTGAEAALDTTVKLGPSTLGLLALFATGDDDFRSGNSASSFITPMSLLGHHGYWGYTGRLTIQGPTDTGIDDPVNVDGGSYSNQMLGSGLATLQLKATMSLADWWSVYGSVGWFASTAGGIGDTKGFDSYAQNTFILDENLTFDVGLSYAVLGKGHHAVEAPTGERESRGALAAVSRLQLEW